MIRRWGSSGGICSTIRNEFPHGHLLQTLAEPQGNRMRIRILLLSRTASWEQGWLTDIISGRTGEDVWPYLIPSSPIPLPALGSEQRHAIFQRMVEAIAMQTRKLVPIQPALEAFGGGDCLDSASPRFRETSLQNPRNRIGGGSLQNTSQC